MSTLTYCNTMSKVLSILAGFIYLISLSFKLNEISAVYFLILFYYFFACAIWIWLEGLQLFGVSSKCGLNCLYTPRYGYKYEQNHQSISYSMWPTGLNWLSLCLMTEASLLHPTFFQSIMQFLFPCCYDCMRQSLALEKAAASQGIKIKGEKNLHKPLKHTHYYGPCYLRPLENL